MQVEPVGGATSLSTVMSPADRAAVEEQANLTNKANLIDGRVLKQNLDKNDFLTLLVTQLKNQDPSAPLEDKQFIAQMAQFSQLEQMNNMSAEFQKLAGMLSSGQAFNVLGRPVSIADGDKTVSGQVTEVKGGPYPQVQVNGKYYDYSNIVSVKLEK